MSTSTIRCGIAFVFGYTEMNTISQVATQHILFPISATCFDYLNLTITRQHSQKKGTVHIKFLFDSVQPNVVEPGWLSRYSDSLRAGRHGDRIPVAGEISRTCSDRPWGPPSLLYNGYRVFPGGKATGAWR